MLDLNSLMGRTFGGDYTIVEKLGEGGMGAVFRAIAGRDGPSVAIKILHPSLAEETLVRARFEREAVMAAQIDHPNVVRVIAHGEEQGLPYIVMEMVSGRDLFEVLTEEGQLTPARAASIALQICDAVATAHEGGIIHRDLKPENVMLLGDASSAGCERVKLLDFGVAKQLHDFEGGDGKIITVAGSIVGTPAYMSPEQCLGEPVDARSDVYACGAVLYHLVTGCAPFEDESPLQTLVRHVREEPRPPSLIVPDLDPELEATILKALQKRPEDRHQGAHELWEELLAALPRLVQQERPARAAARPRKTTSSQGATWVLSQMAVKRRAAPTPNERRPRKRARKDGGRGWAPVLVGAVAGACIGLGVVGVTGDPLAWISALVPSEGASPTTTYVTTDPGP
ncbi:Serine/threonine protein kinase PrkC, regulator of stationary phase [Minicystis rosea]|nr:Serine/threonine protein kinase PrkC, regulator of stationary phase [Minicystis rosea]